MVIYKTTNLVTGKIYIGKDSKNDPQYLGSGIKLCRSIEKHGRENFKKEILETCQSADELNIREKHWISVTNSTDNRIGYNIALGGDGGDIFNQLTEEQKLLSLKKRNLTKTEKSLEEREREKILRSERTKEVWHRPGHRENIRSKLLGRKITWKDKIGTSNKIRYASHPPKKISEETRQKLSDSQRGKYDKIISVEIQDKIVELYQTIGPKLIADRLNLSLYLVRRVLKSKGIYKKFQKGIGPVELRNSSISRKGEGNPMFGVKKK